jgi:hypothetical protein
MSAAHVIGRAIGATLLVCGAHFLVRALTGKTPLAHAKDWLERSKAPEPLMAPRPPTDPVDESSWESFPASDPPAHSPKNA